MESKLCDRCCVLVIDDSAMGVVKSISGGKVQYLEYRSKGTDRPPSNMPLAYCVEDILPDLAVLAASTSVRHSPWSFCHLLRKCILDSRPENEAWGGKIAIRLQYIFRKDTPVALRACWNLLKGAESCPRGVLFALEDSQGRL